MSGGEGGSDPATLLADLPAPLWGALLRALRRAMDRMARSELPRNLQPFAGWRPDKLAADKPRAAAAAALASDPALRQLVAEALDNRAAYDAAVEGDARRLAVEHGDEAAIAALVVRGRWDALAVVAGDAVERRAARNRVSAEESRRRRSADAEMELRRLAEALAEARADRDVQRRRAEAADDRRRRDAAELERVRDEFASVRGEKERIEAQLVEERRRFAERAARLRRRLDEARSRARIDEERARAVLADLEELSTRLREALAASSSHAGQTVDRASGRDVRAISSAVPRDVAPARAGRPCRLPHGVSQDSPLAVRALLQVPGIEVLLDGYNVTKDGRGRPSLPLEQQRHWLLRLTASVAARCRRRHTIVFDGTDVRPGPTPSARGVRVLYTVGEETADDRLVALVAGLPSLQPVLVVSSDREVRDGCARLGADTASSGAYLEAIGA